MKKEKKSKNAKCRRYMSIFLVILMICQTLPISDFGIGEGLEFIRHKLMAAEKIAEFDLSEGNITINDSTDEERVTIVYGNDSNTIEVDKTEEIIITSSVYGSNGNSIFVDTVKPVTIHLKNVIISAGLNTQALSLEPLANVHLIIEGSNLLSSSNDFAGIRVPEGAKLTIDEKKETDNSLTVFGSGKGAGIGGNANEKCGDIEINTYVTAENKNTENKEIADIGDGIEGNTMSGSLSLSFLYYLQGNTTIGNNGTYIYTSPITDMMIMPELIYTGEEQTEEALQSIYFDTEEQYTVEINKKEFKVEVTPEELKKWRFKEIIPNTVKQGGNYTVYYEKEETGKMLIKTLNVARYKMDFTGNVTTDKEEYVLGENIIITAVPKENPFTIPIETEIEVYDYYDSNLTFDIASMGEDGSYTMTVDTNNLRFSVPEGETKDYTLVVKLITDDNIISNKAVNVKVKIVNAEAKMISSNGTVKYIAKLKDAFSANNKDASVILLKDVTIEEPISVEAENIILDLNGKVISQPNAAKCAIAMKNQQLTIKDTVGGGKIISAGSGIFGNDSSNITIINDVVIEGNAANGDGVYGG